MGAQAFDARRLTFVSQHRSPVTGQDDVRAECDQFCAVFTTTLHITSAPPVVDPHVATEGPAEMLQPLRKRGDASLPLSRQAAPATPG